MSITTPSSDIINRSLAVVLSLDQNTPLSIDQITSGKRVNEQDCYAALVHHALASIKPNLVAQFERQLKPALASYQNNHSDTNLFKISDRILRQLIRDKLLTQEQYKIIRDFAFGKAQLDSNRIKISSEKTDGAKADDTPTRAVSTFYKRLESNQVANSSEIAQFRAEEAKISAAKWRENRKLLNNKSNKASLTTLAATTNAKNTALNRGFLWKPISDSDGQLVILLPSLYTKNVAQVSLYSSEENKFIESGRYSGIGNGDREHYRFKSAGSHYPAEVIVEISLKSGGKKMITIDNPANRLES